MKRTITTIATIAITSVALAQSAGEAYRFSNHNFAMGTARSAAMAGAYTSLGADPASMSVNPAGLAMYRSSEVSITPSLMINSHKTSNSTNDITSTDTHTKFIVSNIAGVFAGEGYALGLTFNRLADFSGRRNFYGSAQSQSIGQMYAAQLDGIPVGDIKTPTLDTYRPFYNHYPDLWNAIMAYQTGFIGNSSENTYGMNGLVNFAGGDRIIPQSQIVTGGAINEFALSGAYNFKDLLYVGATMGFQDLEYREDFVYSETASLANTGSMESMTTRQWLRMSGFGFNLKIGATVRPTPWLRIGMAYHSPTWITMRETSYTDMTGYDREYLEPGVSDTPDLLNDYAMRSPSRFLAGISFTIAKRVIIAVDYERAWYSNMKYQTTINEYGYRTSNINNATDNIQNAGENISANGDINLNNVITTYFKPTNTLRLAVEAQPVNGLFLRVGYSYTSSPYQSVQKDIYNYNPESYGAISMYTAGLGYRTGIFGIDVTYTNYQTSMLPSKFYSYAPTDVTKPVIQSEGFNFDKLTRHQILLTLSFKIN